MSSRSKVEVDTATKIYEGLRCDGMVGLVSQPLDCLGEFDVAVTSSGK